MAPAYLPCQRLLPMQLGGYRTLRHPLGLREIHRRELHEARWARVELGDCK